MESLFAFLGGLGIFLFGIKLTGESLKLYAGDRLRILIDKHTSNPIKGVIVGALATVAMQTSTGTTALTISLVKSGQMKLKQAISIIMGANVGTTFTAFLIGLKVADYALPIIFIGSVMYNFSKQKKTNLLGQVLIGFGALFLGLSLMQAPLRPLASSQLFNDLMISVGNIPLLGVLLGIGLTVIVQSSTAMIGIIQSLYGVQAITLFAGTAMVLGSNVGTTITAIIAAAGGNTTTKQAALSHVLFNTFGLILFYIILFVFNGISFLESIFEANQINPEMQLAIIHGVFSIVTAIVLLPLINQLEDVVTKLIKDDATMNTINFDESILNPRLIDESPAFALRQVKQAIIICFDIVDKQLNDLKMYVNKPSESLLDQLQTTSHTLITVTHKIRLYLTLIISKNLDAKGLQSFNVYSSAIKDLESFGEIAITIKDQKVLLKNDVVQNELVAMVEQLALILMTTKQTYITKKMALDTDLSMQLGQLKMQVEQYSLRQIETCATDKCDNQLAFRYLELLNEFLSLSVLLKNIGETQLHQDILLETANEVLDLHEYI